MSDRGQQLPADHQPHSATLEALLALGDMRGARDILGRPFTFSGLVIRGEQRGRTLGFPTANIDPGTGLRPRLGVYAGLADGRAAAISIGLRPTFQSELGELIEVHVLDFRGDLYGCTLCVEFLEFLRAEERFEDVSELVVQMHLDIEATRRIAAEYLT